MYVDGLMVVMDVACENGLALLKTIHHSPSTSSSEIMHHKEDLANRGGVSHNHA